MPSLDWLAKLSTVVQAVLVIVSLILILLQLRQNAGLAKAANAQALVEHASSVNALLIDNPDLTRVWYSRGRDLKDAYDRARYRELLVQWLIFHENIYYQHRKRLLDESIYNSWREDLKYTVQRHNLAIVTDDLQGFFPGEFGQHLIRLQSEPTNPAFAQATHTDKDSS